MISLLIFNKVRVSTTETVDISLIPIAELFSESLSKLKTAISSKYSDNFLGTLFKNKTKCDELAELCK